MAPGLNQSRKFTPGVIEGGRSGEKRQPPAAGNDHAGGISVPVMGRIAAGVPIDDSIPAPDPFGHRAPRT